MDLLDQNRSQSPRADASAPTEVPRPLRPIVQQGFKHLPWAFASTSVRSCDLFADEDGSRVSLLKIKPGGKVGKHSHMGNEFTIVLTGSFSDEDDIYHAGDFMVRDGRHEHTPVATRDRECICLTLQEGPLQFTDRLLRLLNPFLRRGFNLA